MLQAIKMASEKVTGFVDDLNISNKDTPLVDLIGEQLLAESDNK